MTYKTYNTDACLISDMLDFNFHKFSISLNQLLLLICKH